jgi:hypothetical protein
LLSFRINGVSQPLDDYFSGFQNDYSTFETNGVSHYRFVKSGQWIHQTGDIFFRNCFLADPSLQSSTSVVIRIAPVPIKARAPVSLALALWPRAGLLAGPFPLIGQEPSSTNRAWAFL